MECNKDEAARAQRIAEEKMKAGDFVGAYKFVTKAQRLFPDLENIVQMLAVCDVHSSADKKISGLDNWYAVLQVQYFADTITIKKQYRKLALLLHPDKNKFAGAEAAFKLVGEAYRFLSDQIKRSQYDVRYRSHSGIASRQSNANSGRYSAAPNYAADSIASVTFWTCCKHCGHRYKYLREYINSVMHCSSCKNSYKACVTASDGVPPSSSISGKKEFQNQGVYDTARQNSMASTGAESGNSAAETDKNGKENQKKVAGDRKPKKDETGTNNSTEIPKADVLKPRPEVKEPETGAEKSIPDLAAPKKKQAARKKRKSAEESTKSSEVDGSDVVGAETDTNGSEVKEPETGAANSIPDLSAPKKKQAAKKKRKSAEESTKSSEVDGSDVARAETDTNEYSKRRSLKKKPQVSCAEVESDADFVSPPTKKTRPGCEVVSDSNMKQTAEDNKSPELAGSDVSPASSHADKGKAKENVNSGNEDILLAKNKESEGCKANGEDAALSSKIDKVKNGYKANGNPNKLDIPDPEFNVFDDERKTEKFDANQVWSICDSRDGMPRKYVRVKKVLNAEFKLRITYLEPIQDENDKSILVACGHFKNGETKQVTDRSIFSCKMINMFSRKVFISPMEGEIWALFREWHEEWDTSLEKHKLPYKYDFVEILSNFHDKNGVGVAYLGKLKGFVSLFNYEAQNGICQIQFPPEEIGRFSHRIPAVKMSGEEKECVPAGSYELDPAALPKYLFQVDAVDDMEMDSENLKGNANTDVPYSQAPQVEVKTKPVSETAPSARKRRKSDDDDDDDTDNCVCSDLGKVKGGTSKNHDSSSCQADEKNTPNVSRKIGQAFERRKSPRLQKIPSPSEQQNDEKKNGKQGTEMNDTPKKTDKGLMTYSLRISKSPNGIHQPAENQVVESLKKKQARRNGESPSQSKQNDLPTQVNDSSVETTPVSSPSCRTPGRIGFDFNSLRSEDKFRVNQIWAIYSDKGMPKEYVKIKKIVTKPGFKLHITHMELFPPSSVTTCPVSVGEFKLKTGKPKILLQTSFSHQVNHVQNATKKNIMEVYPRKGEIWALYKNRDSTTEEEAHEIVEVVEDGEMVKVVPLKAFTSKGSNSLYTALRTHGSSAGLIDIPKVEVSRRFSHEIPGFRHQTRTTRRLVERVCWELDSRAIPGRTILLN